jgi:hypothetical protein
MASERSPCRCGSERRSAPLSRRSEPRLRGRMRSGHSRSAAERVIQRRPRTWEPGGLGASEPVAASIGLESQRGDAQDVSSAAHSRGFRAAEPTVRITAGDGAGSWVAWRSLRALSPATAASEVSKGGSRGSRMRPATLLHRNELFRQPCGGHKFRATPDPLEGVGGMVAPDAGVWSDPPSGRLMTMDQSETGWHHHQVPHRR